MASIGVIAGTGDLPIRVVRDVTEQGYETIALAFEGFTSLEIEKTGARVYWLKLGQLGKAIDCLKENGITRVVMAGKIDKSNLLQLWRLRPDRRALGVIRRLADWRDDTVLAGIADELAIEGIKIDNITLWASGLMARQGILTRKDPTKHQIEDIGFGREMALAIGALDIGQTVVVKNRAVLVVEAIEGTDKAILRAGELNIPNSVVVKMAKPKQDMRFDVPGVGPSTIKNMMVAGARVLAIETGKTMIANHEETINLADRAKICVIGIPASGPII
ncbi:MAG: UDP-2,3-diacylglucosamine diphosphatase LpxI [Deltaproteobacteria bacterium]|nr:UDP-2,3-diacylglucosamine diphosphatase LpxI [Deltaproteobacteria bacterium]